MNRRKSRLKQWKKWIPVFLILILAGGVFCYGAASAATFDQIMDSSGYPAEFEPAPGSVISVLHSPAFGDSSPIDQTPYQAVLTALRSTKYIPLPLPLSMNDGGTVVETSEGCFPGYMAYWNRGILWLSVEDGWQPCLPVDGDGLKLRIGLLVNHYGYRIKSPSL